MGTLHIENFFHLARLCTYYSNGDRKGNCRVRVLRRSYGRLSDTYRTQIPLPWQRAFYNESMLFLSTPAAWARRSARTSPNTRSSLRPVQSEILFQAKVPWRILPTVLVFFCVL